MAGLAACLWSGGEGGECLAAPAAGFRREAGGGPAGVFGLACVVGVEDPLVAGDDQGGGEESVMAVTPVSRHQPRLMLLLAGSLAVEKVRSAAVRRA